MNNFDLFLTKIFQGYSEYSVSYHNDLHALEVMKLSSGILRAGMSEELKLDNLEIVAVLLGGLCHDFKHDGFTNEYHT